MSATSRLRASRAVPVLLLAVAFLASCGGDDSGDDAEPAEETTTVTVPPDDAATSTSASVPTESTPTSSTSSPTASASTPAGEAPDLATVESIAQEAFKGVKECPNGKFQQTDDLLTTLDTEFANKATELHSYVCGGRIDQVVYAVMPDDATAAEALEPDSGATFNASGWVAGNVVVAMNYGVEGDNVDIVAFYAALTAACGCGETRYEG